MRGGRETIGRFIREVKADREKPAAAGKSQKRAGWLKQFRV